MTEKRRVLAVLQARTSSSRLPGKVLCDLAGAPMIIRQIERIRRARLLDGLVVATSNDKSDDALAALVAKVGVAVYRGSLDDVLDRFACSARAYPSDHLVRLTGDCPLADPDVIDAAISQHLKDGQSITTNTVVPTFPDGLDVEVMRTECLLAAAAEAVFRFEREHVTQFIYRRPERFRVVHYKCAQDYSGLRWTVDEPEDLEFVRAVYSALLPVKPDFGFHDVLEFLREHPDLQQLNSRFMRNEGLARSLKAEFGADVSGR